VQLTNQIQIGKGRRKFNSAIHGSRGLNNGHDRQTGNHTPVAGKVQQPTVDSQDSRCQETVVQGGNT